MFAYSEAWLSYEQYKAIKLEAIRNICSTMAVMGVIIMILLVNPMAGRCRLNVSKPELKARLVSTLETCNVMNRFQTLLSITTCAATPWRWRWYTFA